jgi:uncharacterized protein DUF4349
MDTKFRFLEQLERDLRDAAAREQTAGPAPTRRRPGTRRPPGGRGMTAGWGTIAAALAILLVVAGAIGGLTQLGGRSEQSTEAGGFAAGEPTAAPTRAPGLAPGTDQAKDRLVDASAGGASFHAFEDNRQRADAEPPALQQDLSKIVRDGTITVVVPERGFGDAFDQATAIAEDAGGFVLSSSISQENQGTLTLRVPSKKLDGAVVKLRALGRLAELTLSGRDVTADYIDLKARLQVLQTQRELILKLLNASTTVGGQLSLSNRFADVQTQIEQIQGSLNVLNDKVDLATLKVTLREEGIAAEPNENEVRNPSLGSAWSRAKQGFFGVIGAVVVGLGYLIPVLMLAAVILLVRGAITRRRAAI